MTWASFDDLKREVSQTIDGCQKYLFITRGKEFQEEVVTQLEALGEKLLIEKSKAIKDQAEDRANLLLYFEWITQAFLHFARMWVEIKNDEMDRAWDSLIDAQMAVRQAILVRDNPELQNFNNRLHIIEEVMFPSQMFVSSGFIVESAECSICGSEYGECEHIKDRVYMGQICSRTITNAKIIEVSHVDDPADKHCRAISFSDGGHKRNLMTWRYESESKNENETIPEADRAEN